LAGVVATNSGLPQEVRELMRRQMVLGSGGFPLIGSAETIAGRLAMLSAAGIDGVLLTWLDYAAGLRRFTAEILPLLEERELRAPDVRLSKSGLVAAAAQP